VSPSWAPIRAVGRQIGSDRIRSNIPLVMSVFSVIPVYMVIISTVWTRMPGGRYCR